MQDGYAVQDDFLSLGGGDLLKSVEDRNDLLQKIFGEIEFLEFDAQFSNVMQQQMVLDLLQFS